ncbi:MAG: FAD-dependent oxidoreductase [Bacteroidetes bacterium]|nr:FAD-dependent oxidoreductase [Bacteroidota bacterium]
MKTTVIIGGNFAGFTTALELRRKGNKEDKIIVIDKSPVFLFMPSLIWVPFRRREIKDITVPKENIFRKHRVDFVLAEALHVDPHTQTVKTTKGDFRYDNLVISTGPKVNYDIAPGVKEFAHYIGTPNGAMKARLALDEFKKDPGPVVIGATQNAGCMGAGYEFLFNFEKWCRDNGIRDKVDIHWITPETYLGHFGIDGMKGANAMFKTFFKMFRMHVHTEVGVEKMDAEHVYLNNGTVLPYKFSMLMPPFTGVDFVRNSPELHATANGYMPVGDDYRHSEYPNIWSAGLAVNFNLPWKPGNVPFAAPKTGFPSDVTGKVVAENIIRVEKGKTNLIHKPWGKIAALCIMDAGKKEVIIVANHLFKPRTFAVMIPNLFYDFSKVLFEKYFLWKTRKGLSWLP